MTPCTVPISTAVGDAIRARLGLPLEIIEVSLLAGGYG